MKKILAFIALAFALIVMPSTYTQAASLSEELAPLNRACLPVKGRMQRDQTAACHCPPQGMCPTTIKAWSAGKNLPPEIASICCDKPRQCGFERVALMPCNTQGGLDLIEKEFCHTSMLETSPEGAKTNEYSAFLVRMEAINLKVKNYRDELFVLAQDNLRSQNTPAADVSYAAAERIYKLIDEELALMAVLKKDIEKYNGTCNECGKEKLKITLSCANKYQEEVTFCVRRVAATCPVTNNCVKMRGDLDAQHAIRTRADGTTYFADEELEAFKKYAESVKEQCPVVSWQDCVAENSMITMADGSKRKIQDVKIGEFVKGYNSNNKVTGLSLEEHAPNRLFSINGEKLHITGGHPILTVAGWKAINPSDVEAVDQEFKKTIGKLEEGDEILVADEATVIVKSVTAYTGPKTPTYNISVNGDMTFIANGLVIRGFKNSTQY